MKFTLNDSLAVEKFNKKYEQDTNSIIIKGTYTDFSGRTEIEPFDIYMNPVRLKLENRTLTVSGTRGLSETSIPFEEHYEIYECESIEIEEVTIENDIITHTMTFIIINQYVPKIF